jgi:hypothetical protein
MSTGNTRQERFDYGLARLRAYKDVHGNCDVQTKYCDEDGYPLGKWLVHKRIRWNSGILSPDQAKALQELGFDPDPNTTKFNRGLSALRAFKDAHGHCDVPQRYACEDGYPLGQWVSVQRKALKNGELPPDRLEALQTIGLAPSTRTAGRSFAESLDALRAYKATHGNCNVPSGFVASDGYGLGRWVEYARERMRAGTLTPEATKALKDIGLSPLAPTYEAVEVRFSRGLAYLREFKSAHGHCDVPQKYCCEDGYRLGSWVVGVRDAWKAGRLPPDRLKEVQELGLAQTSPLSDQYGPSRRGLGLESLRTYKAAHGHCHIPSDYRDADGFPLGRWAMVQRGRMRDGTLPAEVRKTLEGIGLGSDLWSMGAVDFDVGLRYLKEFKDTFGHVDVPRDHHAENGFPLGEWLANRRNAAKEGKAPQRQIDALRELGVILRLPGGPTVFDEMFRQSFAHLERFKSEHGHVRVPDGYVTEDGFNLGMWLRNHRQNWRKGKMPADRIAMMESLGVDKSMGNEASADEECTLPAFGR